MTSSSSRLNWTLCLLGIVALVLLPLILQPYALSQASSWLYLAVAVLSLTLLVGVSGQISVGHSAFVGIGAYVSIILTANYGWNFWLACLAAILAAMVTGVVVNLPALRLSGLYVAIPTIGLALVFPSWIQAAQPITGGYNGKALTAPLMAPGWLRLEQSAWIYYVSLIVAVSCFIIVHFVKQSRHGRALQAIRDHERAAEAFGVNVSLYKILVFMTSAGLAGVAGCMFAMQKQFVSPVDFALLLAISLFTGMAVGGQYSVPGALLGAAFLQYAQDGIEQVGLDPLLVPALYGVLLILIIIWFREGLAGAVRRLGTALQRRKVHATATPGSQRHQHIVKHDEVRTDT